MPVVLAALNTESELGHGRRLAERSRLVDAAFYLRSSRLLRVYLLVVARCVLTMASLFEEYRVPSIHLPRPLCRLLLSKNIF